MALDETSLQFPDHVSVAHRRTIQECARRVEAEYGEALLGLVLSGSVGRGLATHRSDVDLYVVLADDAHGRSMVHRSPDIDEAQVTLTGLEQVPTFGSEGWWYRWSFAWAPVILDRTSGRLADAARRQATVSTTEAESILVEHDRLDGWLNYAYRALKSDRDDRPLERRLDAAESMPWLLDVIFSLAGRVRPYHKYLPWELREHPLPDWGADELLDLLAPTLDGDPSAIRATFERVESACLAYDERCGTTTLASIIDDWGAELDLLRA